MWGRPLMTKDLLFIEHLPCALWASLLQTLIPLFACHPHCHVTDGEARVTEVGWCVHLGSGSSSSSLALIYLN